jgi:hypothetical protein
MLKQAAQHPGGLLVNFQALRQKVGRWLVIGSVNDRE